MNKLKSNQKRKINNKLKLKIDKLLLIITISSYDIEHEHYLEIALEIISF